ncbi:MAG TPA: TlpA disulfide reductase family protein [Actinomycetota bacterium]|nr:TlpA disulfide reductase family protein [Actinomycetota bacterium]
MAAAAPPDQAPAPRPKGPVRSGRRLILVVLVVVAVVLPAAATLLGRRAPATRLEPLTPPAAPSTAVQTYPAGTPAPALRLPGLDGAQVDLAALRGRPVVVNFWATWCEPCVREFPLLRSAAADHRGQRLVVVGVLAGDRPAAGRAFVRRHRATWPVGLDPDAAAAGRWGAVGLPHTYFVRADGTLASHQLGELTRASLDRQLARILR